jgi:hypothetical protein
VSYESMTFPTCLYPSANKEHDEFLVIMLVRNSLSTETISADNTNNGVSLFL